MELQPTPADTIVEEAVQIRTARSRWRECARDYTNMCNRRIGRGRRDQEAGGVEPGLITEEGVLRWWTAPFVRGRQSNGGHWVENTVEGNRASAPAKRLLSRDSSSTMARGVDEMTMGEGEEAGSGRDSAEEDRFAVVRSKGGPDGRQVPTVRPNDV
ncbi:unnamed protein product [Mycena citricolor]|uniref:Uncharacterized protein n=1 Tax=Mycena citricolor TaxID=2018698 RepID=A0AAD2HVM8_9AGAR|nr:unnamed protein product [Mycena citricolor]